MRTSDDQYSYETFDGKRGNSAQRQPSEKGQNPSPQRDQRKDECCPIRQGLRSGTRRLGLLNESHDAPKSGVFTRSMDLNA
jgi:hypothetical protein